MLGLLILDYKIGYRLWFVCQWIQYDLILYLESEEEHADMTSRLSIVLMMIFSMIARSISRLSCSEWS